jgi:hypothetical protein
LNGQRIRHQSSQLTDFETTESSAENPSIPFQFADRYPADGTGVRRGSQCRIVISQEGPQSCGICPNTIIDTHVMQITQKTSSSNSDMTGYGDGLL